jgi:E3 ubiquitin-protein ligase HACE1
MLGVNEATGELLSGDDAPQPSAIGVRFEGENGTGDGLRREWFDGIVSEMLDLTRGLFISKDGGRSLVPNPHSATTAGADHLSYFALLGRIAGLALFHREPLNANWSRSFIKAVFEFELTPADLESVDPDAYKQKVLYIRDCDRTALEDLELTFTDQNDNDMKLLYDSLAERDACVELKEGGAEISVTEENKAEYIQLLVEHRVVGAIRPQITAFRNGLGGFVTAALQAKLRQCATAADMQLLMCGVQEIDVDDWQASAEYSGGFDASSRTVLWFWAAVRRMTNEERSALLLFCTGSARAPATGFAHLMGIQESSSASGCSESRAAASDSPPHQRASTRSACLAATRTRHSCWEGCGVRCAKRRASMRALSLSDSELWDRRGRW